MPAKANAFFLAKEAARQIKTCGSPTFYDGHTPCRLPMTIDGIGIFNQIRSPMRLALRNSLPQHGLTEGCAWGFSMRTVAALVACACVLGGANRAAADQLTSFNVGNWSGGAYSDATGSKTFSYCAGSASYNSGITVVFFVDSNFQWGIGFFNSAWNLTSGSSYPIGFAVDFRRRFWEPRPRLPRTRCCCRYRRRWRYSRRSCTGRILKVNVSAGSFQFKLTDTVELLPDLLKCAEAYSGKAPASSNPFAN